MTDNRLVNHFSDFIHLGKVVKHGSINRAAAAGNITQPALTRAVRRLEDVLGIQLLERSSFGVAPTPVCKALITHIDTIERELSDAVRTIDFHRSGKLMHLRCGATTLAMQTFLPCAVQRFGSNQGTTIEIVSGELGSLVDQVRRHDIHLLIGPFEPKSTEDLQFLTELGSYELHIYARRSHPLSQLTNCDADKLLDATWILPAPDTHRHRQFLSFFKNMGLQAPQKVVYTTAWDMTIRLALELDALFIAPYQLVSAEIARGIIVPLKGIQCRTHHTQSVMTWPRRKVTNIEKSFLADLKSVAGMVLTPAAA